MKTRPIDVDHADGHVVPRSCDVAAVARGAGGIVGRPQQPRLGPDVIERLFLVPDVIAGRHHVHAQVEELVADFARDAEPRGRVLAVGDDEVDLMAAHQGGKTGPDELPSRSADDVADEEDSHGRVRRVYANPGLALRADAFVTAHPHRDMGNQIYECNNANKICLTNTNYEPILVSFSRGFEKRRDSSNMANKVIGIDLGTTNSVVAVMEAGSPRSS